MKVIVAGVGRLGEQAGHLLAATGHQVTVIEQDQARLSRLTGLRKARLVHGDACEPHVLEEAGVLNTDLLIAATGDDEDNLVLALLAKRQFAVPRTLARVNDPDNAWLFDARWGVDVALPATTPLVALIEEASGAVTTVGLVRLADAGVTLIETHVDDHSKSVGRAIGDLTLPTDTMVAAVVRGGHPFAPRDDYRFHAGDTVLVLTTTATENEIHSAFQ